MAEYLTPAEEKIYKYLLEHTSPVAATTLAKRFIISQSRAASLLKTLHERGLADIVQVGKNKFYRLKTRGE